MFQTWASDYFEVLKHFFSTLKLLAEYYISLINILLWPIFKFFELIGFELSQFVVNGILGSFAQMVLLIGYIKNNYPILSQRQIYFRAGGEVKYYVFEGWFHGFVESVSKKKNKLIKATSILYVIYIIDVAVFVSVVSALVTLISTTTIVCFIISVAFLFDYLTRAIPILFLRIAAWGSECQIYTREGGAVSYSTTREIKFLQAVKMLLDKFE